MVGLKKQKWNGIILFASLLLTGLLVGCLKNKVVDPDPVPEFIPIAKQTVSEGQELTLNVSATSPLGDTVTFSVLNPPENGIFFLNDSILTWIPHHLDAGSHIFQVEAKAGGLTSIAEVEVEVLDVPVSYAQQVQPIFNGQCIECHNVDGGGYDETGGLNKGLDLTETNSWQLLVNVPSFQARNLSPQFRVLPGDVEESYLIQKMDPNQTPKYGEIMPYRGFGGLVEPFNIELIKAWILEGAANN